MRAVDVRVAVRQHGVVEAQRLQDALSDSTFVGLVGDLLDQLAEDGEAGVVVLPLRAGLELERLGRRDGDELGRLPLLEADRLEVLRGVKPMAFM